MSKYADQALKAIVQDVISQLEKGTPPWTCPYKRTPLEIPSNLSSKRPYRGINILQLWMSARKQRFTSCQWVTYKQAAQLGGHIKPGAKGTKVMFWNMEELDEEPDPTTGEIKTRWVKKVYSVFNLDQTEGLVGEEKGVSSEQVTLGSSNAVAEDFMQRTGARIVVRPGATPVYDTVRDYIELPPADDFISAEEYYATGFHELGHWTGHKSRLNRLERCKFGDAKYAFEELVAELTSAFLCSRMDIPLTKVQHPGYMDHWISALNEKPQILWSAATQSQRAYDYLVDEVERTRRKAGNQ